MDIVNISCSRPNFQGHKVTLLVFTPEYLIVFQVLFGIAFFVLLATVCGEIFFFVRQQLRGERSLARIFCVFDRQLIKLLLLATAALVRVVWTIEPYPPLESYSTGTAESIYHVKELLLRVPQVIIYIIILMQVGAWRAVVEKSTNFKRTSTTGATTMDKIVSSTSMTMVVILVGLAILELFACRECKLILYTTMAYSAILVPAAFFYVRKLRDIVSSVNFGSGSSGNLRKLRAVSKVTVVQRSLYELIFATMVLLLAVILVLALNPKTCKKGHYKEEALKFFSYLVTVHTAELFACTALFKSLRDLRTKEKLPEAIEEEEQTRATTELTTELDDITIPSKI